MSGFFSLELSLVSCIVTMSGLELFIRLLSSMVLFLSPLIFIWSILRSLGLRWVCLKVELLSEEESELELEVWDEFVGDGWTVLSFVSCES